MRRAGPAHIDSGARDSVHVELHRAADGEVREGRGVPLGVRVDFDPAAFSAGRDVMREAVLSLLGGEARARR